MHSIERRLLLAKVVAAAMVEAVALVGLGQCAGRQLGALT